MSRTNGHEKFWANSSFYYGIYKGISGQQTRRKKGERRYRKVVKNLIQTEQYEMIPGWNGKVKDKLFIWLSS